jgi:hypothetical protein
VGNHRGRKKPKRLAEKLLAIRFKLEVSQNQLAKLLEFDKGSAAFLNTNAAHVNLT